MDDRVELKAVAKLFILEEPLPLNTLTLTAADAATLAAGDLGDSPRLQYVPPMLPAARY